MPNRKSRKIQETKKEIRRLKAKLQRRRNQNNPSPPVHDDAHEQVGTSDEQADSVPPTAEFAFGNNLLALLGDAAETDAGKAIAAMWQDVLQNGLSDEERARLQREYAIPRNCEFLLPPQLNPEVKEVLPECIVEIDEDLADKQKQLGHALTALAQAIELIDGNETDTENILKPIMGACELLCDVHHSDTELRRNLIMADVNDDIKKILVETKPDEFLFGSN